MLKYTQYEKDNRTVIYYVRRHHAGLPVGRKKIPLMVSNMVAGPHHITMKIPAR